jgi:hypothetical protein
VAAHGAVRGAARRAVAVDRRCASSHRTMLHVTSDLQVVTGIARRLLREGKTAKGVAKMCETKMRGRPN